MRISSLLVVCVAAGAMAQSSSSVRAFQTIPYCFGIEWKSDFVAYLC